MYTAVLEFLDSLAELPRDVWLDLGRAIRADTDRLAGLSGVRAILHATIADKHLALSAWHVRDAIETIAYLMWRAPGDLPPRDRRYFDATHAAAEEAALAILARPHLAEHDFALLYAPFAAVIPQPAPDRASAV